VGTGTLLLVTLYLQNVTGLTPLAAGLLLLMPNALMIVGSLATPQLADRVRPVYLIAGGLLVAGAGYLIFMLADATSGPEMIFIAMCVVMFGTAPLAALCNHLAMGAVPSDKAGSGASIVQTTTEFAIGLGIATLATLGTAVYRSNVEGALGAVPPDAADAARESIDRAVIAAGELPAAQSGDLLAAAREAFTSGIHTVGIISAIFYAGLAVLAMWAFRHVRNAHGGHDDTTYEDKVSEPVPEPASAATAKPTEAPDRVSP
jgi:DHA2 family multidrug resistance protein-like MFS transporter